VPTDPDDPTRERWPRGDGSSTADELYPQVGPHRRGAAARDQPDWWDVAEESGAGIEQAPRAEPAEAPPAAPKAARAKPTKAAGGPAAQEAAEAVSGPELARAVIDAALTKRREAARNPRRRTGEGTGKRLRGYSGPGPDPRDPQLFGAVLGRLMKARGWEKPKAEATVFGAWEKVVGADIAAHSRPIKLDDGVLTVEAESTAWATQLRMLAAGLLRSIAAEVGHNVVTKLNIHGPAAPSWAKGPRRVQGRGPRDTYG
jgi:predicted nucleic acid-binding Zn ribbon protein